jgi:hypothetical protein
MSVGSHVAFEAGYRGAALFGADGLRISASLFTGPSVVVRSRASATFNLGLDAGGRLSVALSDAFALLADATVVFYFPKRIPIEVWNAVIVRAGLSYAF